MLSLKSKLKMEKLGNVQQKIHCVFETRVVEEPSGKRSHQAYKVVAGENIRPEAEESGISDAVPTEKLDGTCVFVDNFEGMPWLWARHDRKPNKNADRRFKKFQNTHRGWIANGKNGPEPHFSWNLNSDLKDIPGYWVPAKGVAMNDEGTPMPDENGHIPGIHRNHCVESLQNKNEFSGQREKNHLKLEFCVNARAVKVA